MPQGPPHWLLTPSPGRFRVDDAPFELLRRVANRSDGEACVLLDGEWGVVAARPSASLCVTSDGAVWHRDGPGTAWRTSLDVPWDALRTFVRDSDGRHVIGLLSYDAGRLIERIPDRTQDDTCVPLLLFHRFDSLVDKCVTPPLPLRGEEAFSPITHRTSPKEFEQMVLCAKEHVRVGDVFQVNLSHRLETATMLHPVELYGRLRVANPAPYAAYFSSGPLPGDAGGFAVLSSSPERLFRLCGRTLEAKPIAGTRKRSDDAAEDSRLAVELRGDAKEQAEHVMLVDLARNDLGRVAAFGSVCVPRLLDVESYASVHHLVSTVKADLADGKDVVDAIRALFPGGTITGAPKVRAMEIIEEIESQRRGVYTGSLAWIGPDGDADVNILIRTLLARKGRVHVQIGAGIVQDSVPTREYEETLAKAKGMLRALGGDL